MQKKIGFFIAAIVVALLACSVGTSTESVQGSGAITSEERQVQGVRGVTLSTLGELTIQLGDSESLTVEAEDNLLPYLESQVSNGILTIRNTSNVNLRPTQPVRYNLTVPSIESLALSSSGNISAPALQADNFTIRISSSGNITLAGLSADDVTVDISSSGNFTLATLSADNISVDISSSGDVVIDEGQVDNQNIRISSSGNYQAGDVSSQTAAVRISSSGNVTLWTTVSLTVTISSSGDVNYYGNPAITQTLTSSGRINALGDK